MTLDSDTFFSLTVTNMHDPMALKSAIVNKLGMNVMYLDHYQFYHENGENSGKYLFALEGQDGSTINHTIFFLCRCSFGR